MNNSIPFSVSVVEKPKWKAVMDVALSQHLRLGDAHCDHYANLDNSIAAAERMFERLTNRSVTRRTLKLTMDRFPETGGMIYLPRGPVAEIATVTYIDAAGAEQTLDASAYVADLDHVPPRLAAVDAWPATKDRIGAVAITYVAGQQRAGSAVDPLPDDVHNAILMLAALYFENPEGVAAVELKAIPMAVQTVVDMYRLPEVSP